MASLLVAHRLGYDAFAWMVWAHELLHGNLQTLGGPSFKALPVIVTAPLTPFSDLAPLAWLGAMRISALLSIVFAARVAYRLGGRLSAVSAALLLAIAPDLFRTALYGSAEPLVVLLMLVAVERYLVGAPRIALALLGVAGLMRPELWPFVAVFALVVLVRERRLNLAVLATAIVPPVIWLGLAWAGSGSAFYQFAQLNPVALCSRCAVITSLPVGGSYTPALNVLRSMTEAIVPPALVLAIVPVVVALRRGRREPVAIAACAVAWVLLIALMADMGYPGSRRYLVPAAALVAVLAGTGLPLVLRVVRRRSAQFAIGAVIAASVVATGYSTVLQSARLVGVARAQGQAIAGLRGAIKLAGGRRAVLAAGNPAINPWSQTALAWYLKAPLSVVQPAWHSKPRHPHWTPPAIVFRGPAHLLGPQPSLSSANVYRRLGRTSSWTVLRATRRAPAD